MATVNKNFRVKNGLVVEGTTATVNGNNILTDANTTDDITEGSTNQYFTDEKAVDAVATAISNGSHTNITITYDDANDSISFTGSSSITDTDDVPEGSTNLYFTDARAQAAVSSTIAALDTDDISEGATNLYFTDARAVSATSSSYDAAGSAATAESNANSYTDSLIGDATVDGTGGNTVTDRIATAVANLVDAAPGALDTLNELAAAINDDASFSTTITTAIGEKVAKSGDTMTGDLTLAQDPTSNLHAATKQYVDAVSTTVSNLDTDDIAEGATNLYFTDARAQSAVDDTARSFTSVDINSIAKHVAAEADLTTTSQTAVYSFAKADYRSAKFLVKSGYGTHTEVSEVLITLDTSDNVAIMEYGEVTTNGNLVTLSAGINGTNVELLATAGTATTYVKVVGTLIA